jgi:lysophospholipase L1-like esterase
MIRITRRAALAVALLVVAAGCNNDQLNRPFSVTPVDPLFARYVSMGNSITAGFQSGGILDSTQRQSYAVLLAHAMRSPFYEPLMQRPGCPPPFTNVFTGARLTPPGFPPSTATSCYLRSNQSIAPPYISNVAVPGAKVVSLYNNLDTAAHSNSLTQFFLGGLTQVQAMRRAQPTFVSLWIGNNDVLGAATAANAGDSTEITPVATFQTQYATVLSAIDSAKPKGGVLIGVANVTEIPYFSAGAVYFVLKNQNPSPFPATFTVSTNCAPVASGIPGARGDSVLVPFPYGAALIGAAQAGAARNLDCGDSVAAIVVPSELIKLIGAVTAYNAYISSQATARHWAYLDPNPTLDSLRTQAAPTVVRAFPLLGAACSANPFGTAFTCDGVHPSAATHKLIAQKLRLAINGAYSTSIPAIP